MNCPYCNVVVDGITGLEELVNFQDHLNQCPNAPRNVFINEHGVQIEPPFTMADALEIRAKSGQ